jgi:hypothetical protein
MVKDTVKDTKELFVSDLDAMFYGPNRWQGGVWELIKDLSAEQAKWKPSENRPCIWEYVRHAAYWKYAATLVARNEVANDVEKPGSETDWKSLKDASMDEAAWQNELKEVKSIHENFKKAVSELEPECFEKGNGKGDYVRGILYHDAYHGGQIGMLRVMQGIKHIM